MPGWKKLSFGYWSPDQRQRRGGEGGCLDPLGTRYDGPRLRLVTTLYGATLGTRQGGTNSCVERASARFVQPERPGARRLDRRQTQSGSGGGEKLGGTGSARGRKTARQNCFYNRPMDPTKIRTFEAYGGAVDQRASGASRASKYGAVAVLVRSISSTEPCHSAVCGTTLPTHLFPLRPSAPMQPNNSARFCAKTEAPPYPCRRLPHAADVLSYNVIGEIRGSERPGEVIVVGGHLDSLGCGAWRQHDDGAGCTQAWMSCACSKQQATGPGTPFAACFL